MTDLKTDSKVLKIDDFFKEFDFLSFHLVPDGMEPEKLVGQFDHPEILCVISDFEIPVICLKEYRDDVLEMIEEMLNRNPEPTSSCPPGLRLVH